MTDTTSRWSHPDRQEDSLRFDEIQKEMIRYKQVADQDASDYDYPCPAPWKETAEFCQVILEGDWRGAARLFNQAIYREHSLPAAEIHLIQPALYQIGKSWQKNEISIVKEHLATYISETLMAQGYGRIASEPDNGLKALFACSPGNLHTIGLRMVADAFEVAGWTVHFMGANVSITSLLAAIEDRQPDLVALSASLPQQVCDVMVTIDSLRTRLGKACPEIAVGGLVFNQFPLIASTIEAELLGPDAMAAVQSASILFNQHRR